VILFWFFVLLSSAILPPFGQAPPLAKPSRRNAVRDLGTALCTRDSSLSSSSGTHGNGKRLTKWS